MPKEPIQECVGLVADVYFVVDVSRSIQKQELIAERKAVTFLIGGFDIAPDKSRVGLIKFYKNAEQEFSLSRFSSREELSHHDMLSRKPGKVPGGTRTDLGLNMMMDGFRDEQIDDRMKIAFIVTDGKATAKLDETLVRLNQMNIERISIGVGGGAGEDELRDLASGGGDDSMYKAKNFEELQGVINSIIQKLCKKVNPAK